MNKATLERLMFLVDSLEECILERDNNDNPFDYGVALGYDMSIQCINGEIDAILFGGHIVVEDISPEIDISWLA